MRFTLLGLLRAKPFDESSDPPAGDIYVRSPLLAVLIVLGAGLCLAGMYQAATGGSSETVVVLIALAVAVSAITAGIEWNAGLKARALNQLFWVLVVLILIAGLQSQDLANLR